MGPPRSQTPKELGSGAALLVDNEPRPIRMMRLSVRAKPVHLKLVGFIERDYVRDGGPVWILVRPEWSL
jgi:hypothetical protein